MYGTILLPNHKRGQLSVILLLRNELTPEIRHNGWAYLDRVDRTSVTYELVKPKNMKLLRVFLVYFACL